MEEEVLITVSVDTEKEKVELEKLNKSITTLSTGISGLTAENKKLNQNNKTLTKSTGDNSKAVAENNAKIALNKGQIGQMNKQRRASIQAVQAESNSLGAMKARLAANKIERDKLNLSTKEGQKRLKAITKEIRKDNDALKDAEQAAGNYGRNVGNYGDALAQANPALGAAITGIKGMTKAALVFLATPLGLVIGAIGLALGALITFFTKTQRGADILNKVMAALGAIFDEIIDTVSAVGETIFEAISTPKQLVIDLGDLIKTQLINRFKAFGVIGRSIAKIFRGDFKEGFKELGNGALQLVTGVENLTDKVVDFSNKAKEAFTGLTERIIEEAKAAFILQDAVNKLRDAEIELSVVEAERRKRIQELIFITRVETATQKERRQALVEADKIERQSLIDVLALQRERVRILGEQQALGENLAEDDKLFADEKIKLIELETASLSRRRELLNRMNELENKFRAENKLQKDADIKVAAAEKEASEELQLFRLEQQAELAGTTQQRIQAEIDAEILKTAFLLQNDALLSDERILLQEQLAANIAEIQKKSVDEGIEQDKKLADAKKKTDEDVTKSFTKAFGERSTVGKAFGALAQKGLITETIANTEAAAIAAFKSLAGIPIVGPVLGAAAAIAIGLQGARAVARIAGLTFKEGGEFTIGGNRHSQGGTKFVGSDGSRFEAERGENLYILNRAASAHINKLSALNTMHGGRGFSQGGAFMQAGGAVATENSISTIERRVRGNQELIRIIRELPPPEVNVVKVSRAQNEVAISESRANV